MKRKITKAFISLVMIACLLCMLAACDMGSITVSGNATKEEGGVVPENYKEVTVAGSSFYIPDEASKGGSANGLTTYTFSGGNMNHIATDISLPVKKYKKATIENSLTAGFTTTGMDVDFEINTFKFYNLSGLLVLYVEVTTEVKSQNVAMKQYMMVYDTPTKQVTITVTYNTLSAAENSDMPGKILHSIALDTAE